MKRKRKKVTSIAGQFLACLLVLIFVVQTGFAQQKLGQLLVYGDNFLFSVKEPEGWRGDTENADKFQANVVLHAPGQPSSSYQGLVRILVTEKTDENISADMESDMNDSKTENPKVQFRDLFVKNPHYVCLAKVFYVPGDFYEYVTYVNPGAKSKILFSVSMNTGKAEASEKELLAYKKTVESLTLLKP